jgi:hypothetical protein
VSREREADRVKAAGLRASKNSLYVPGRKDRPAELFEELSLAAH